MKKEDVRKILNLEETIDIIKVEEVLEKNKKVKFIHVKSNKKKARCTSCNQFSKKIHDYLKPCKITYLKNSEEETYLIVYKRRFKCDNCKKAFTEELEISCNNNRISNKTKQLILKLCMDRDKTLTTIAKETNTSVNLVRTTFLEATKNYPDYIETLPEVISFDEVSTKTKEGIYSFILNDPIHKITLDILPKRNKDYLIKYFLKVKNRKSVKVVICDLYRPYYEVVKICFPNAIFVADPFHYTRYVMDGLDKVRIRLEHSYENNKKSYEYLMLKNRKNRKLILKSFNETKSELKKRAEEERKYESGIRKNKPYDKYNDYWYGTMKIKKNQKYIEKFRIDRLHEILNIDDELVKAYNLKEEFLRIITHVKYEDAKRQLKIWIKQCCDSNIPEMKGAASTIKNWINEIVNSFKDERYTNGFTEANNNTIDKIVDRALVILHRSYSGGSQKNIEKERNKI